MLKKLEKSTNNKERNEVQVIKINSGLRDLKEEIEDTSDQEEETESPNEVVNIVEIIFEFNRQQQGQDLKILTPN